MTTEEHLAYLDYDLNQDPGQTAPRDPASDVVCTPNISTAERRKRLAFGLVAFAVGLAILAALVVTGTDRLWRLLLFVPFFGAATGFFQWSGKTWVALAARGSRQLSDQVEKIENPAELAQVRRQARRVQIKSLLAALSLTVIALALPSLGWDSPPDHVSRKLIVPGPASLRLVPSWERGTTTTKLAEAATDLHLTALLNSKSGGLALLPWLVLWDLSRLKAANLEPVEALRSEKRA